MHKSDHPLGALHDSSEKLNYIIANGCLNCTRIKSEITRRDGRSLDAASVTNQEYPCSGQARHLPKHNIAMS